MSWPFGFQEYRFPRGAVFAGRVLKNIVMPAIFYYRHTVQPDEIDNLNHANNVAYVQWLQDAAVAHSSARGWSPERYLALGVGWVVRSHTIEYIRPARLGDEIVVQTWVADFKKVTSRRRYRIYRVEDGVLLAQAETLWAFVTYATGQPTRIHPDVVASFELPGSDPPPYQPDDLKIVRA